MITDAGPMVLLDIGANPDSTAENLAQYARMGAIFAERVLGVADPRVALLSIGEEKGKGDARIQRATELLDATDLQLHRQRRGQGPDHAPGRRRRLRRGPRQRRRSSSSRACRASSSTCCGPSSSGSLRGRLAYAPDAPGHRPDPRRLRLRERRRLAAARRPGTVIITHGRAKRRMIGYACEVAATTARTRRAGAASPRRSRRTPAGRPRPRAAPADVAGVRPRRERPELSVGRGVIARDRPAGRPRGPGRRPGRPRRARRGGASSAARRSASASATSGSRPRLDRRPAGPGRSGRWPRRSGPRSRRDRRAPARPRLGAVTVLVDGVGG